MATFWKPPTDQEMKEISKTVNCSTLRINNEELIIFGLGHLIDDERLPEDYGVPDPLFNKEYEE